MKIRQAFAIQKKAAVLAGVLAALCPALSAQRFLKLPPVEIFGGYSFLRYESKPLGFSDQQNLSGWNAEIAIPGIYKGLGVVADASGHYTREMEEYNFLIGPQFRYEWSSFRFYGHGLFGRARDRLRVPGTTQVEPSNLARAIALGGGIDVPVSKRWTLRLAQGDYLITSNFGGTQHSVRLSTGLVVTFGKH
ncbi:MAG TPA: hypothetical protein VFB00_03465 [Terriglobales bacterium]|nr:hypothetical protein [Terriglobales bacterium]